MEIIDILELFEKCVNGKGECSICPYRSKPSEGDLSSCLAKLGKDIINHINALNEHIEYYEEVIEEYETAELERQELADKLTITPSSWTHDGSFPLWTMEIGDCTSTTSSSGRIMRFDDFTTTTSEALSRADGLATTASSTYAHVEGASTCSLGYDLGSLTTTISESASEKATEYVEAELKKKDKKPRWFEAWTEKT